MPIHLIELTFKRENNCNSIVIKLCLLIKKKYYLVFFYPKILHILNLASNLPWNRYKPFIISLLLLLPLL